MHVNSSLNNYDSLKNEFVVGIGEILWDMLPSGRQVGGAPANFAFHARQLGLNSIIVSAVGNDSLGNELIKYISSVSDLSLIIPSIDKPTGTVNISLNDKGIPYYKITEDVAWDYIALNPQLLNVAKHTAAVCFGSLSQRNFISRSAINSFINNIPAENNALKIFDINLRQSYFSKEIINNSLKICNILKLNDEELITLKILFSNDHLDTKSFCEYLIDEFSLYLVILTCGENGSYVFSKDYVSFLQTPKIVVVDTVGAGDAFTSAFIASILKGKSISDAHRFAVDYSACVCARPGAMPVINNVLI